MLTSFNDLITYSARLEDQRFAVTDILFDARDGALKYLVVDTGAWFESQQTLVAAALIGRVDVENAEIVLTASRDEFERAPRWEGEHEPLIPMLSALPPLVVGPFGSTYAPLALTAEWSALSDERTEDDVDSDPRAEKAVDLFETAHNWLDSAVFGRDGELGSLDDLLVDPDTRKITHLVISNGSVMRGKLLVVPYAVLRYRAKGGHLVLDTTVEKLRNAPQIDQIARLERHWHNDVHGYFMMPA